MGGLGTEPRSIWRTSEGPEDRCEAARFTERQRTVVAMIAAGYSNDEIAGELVISPRTVRAHCDALRFKLRVQHRRLIPAAFRRLTGEEPLGLPLQASAAPTDEFAPADGVGARPRVGADEIAAFRFRRCFDEIAGGTSVASVVEGACGIQAQLSTAAELAIRARLPSIDRAVIRRAVGDQRTVVRTWAARATVHLLAAGDVSLYAAALGRDLAAREAAYLRRRGFSDEEQEACARAIFVALADGPLTRDALADRLATVLPARTLRHLLNSWSELIRPLGVVGAVCFGPPDERRATFVRTDAWIHGGEQPVDATLAGAEVARRYLHVYGPCSSQHFASWAGIPASSARSAWSALGGELIAVESPVGPLSLLRSDFDDLRSPSPIGYRLLPAFDPFVIAAREKGFLLAQTHTDAVFRKAGQVTPTMLVGGRVVGTWSYETHGSAAEVGLQPFDGERLSRAAERAFCEEAADVCRFLGLEPHVRIARRRAAP
jgi:DNA-binding CsgD family transcriptional regulator